MNRSPDYWEGYDRAAEIFKGQATASADRAQRYARRLDQIESTLRTERARAKAERRRAMEITWEKALAWSDWSDKRNRPAILDAIERELDQEEQP